LILTPPLLGLFGARGPRRGAVHPVEIDVREDAPLAPEEMRGSAASGDGDGPIANYRTVALIIACALFMENLDATVLATALPTMARDFTVPVTEVSTALTAYLLALALFIPASGVAADRYGAKRVFLAAIVIFLGGSIACGLAPNLWSLVAARFAQGMGGAMMAPVGRLVLLRSVAKKDIVSAMSWLVMPAMLGPILGPPVGGFIVTYLDWRWIFWLNVPIGVAGFGLVLRFIRDHGERTARPFDILGFLLSSAALGCLLTGFELVIRPEEAEAALPLIVVGAVAGALYVMHARRTAHPILDLSLMKVTTFRLTTIGGSLTRIAQGAQPFLLPLMMQLAFGFSAAKSGLITVAMAIGTFAMKGLARPILRRFGFRDSMVVVGVLSACAYASCGLFSPAWPLPAVFAVLVICGLLSSFQFTAYNTLAYDEISAAQMSAATSFHSTFQQLMLSLGVCAGAIALHVAMTLNGHQTPGFGDFSIAFWTVNAISLTAIFANLRFSRRAGAELSGRA
jgi:EmrB/QacA subfamily drug resistance transporter